MTIAENKVRELASRKGYRVRKSRARISSDNRGDFMLINVDGNYVVMGGRFDATLAEIYDWLLHNED
jgi:hypothetical protein